MPTIGNGYIGTTIYDNAIFLNGIYEGEGCQSIFAVVAAVNLKLVDRIIVVQLLLSQ